MLTDRAGTVLRTIVEQFVTRATPVPSQSIINDELAVSPATIRNDMAHLEKAGYIIRPHSSAGSIPSDKGYRYYVESLNRLELPVNEKLLISHLFHQIEGRLEECLSLAARLTARMAGNIAVVTMPKPADWRLQYLHLVSLQEKLAMLVLIIHGARVRQQLINFEQPQPQSRLTQTANKLNAAYAGLTGSHIKANKMELSPLEKQVRDCIIQLMQTEDEKEADEMHLTGWQFMLNQPEFASSQQAVSLMNLAEQGNLLRTITPTHAPEYGVKVIIGQENESAAIRDYSVVLKQYGVGSRATGTIGVIGPTRMPYARTISTVDYLSSVLLEFVADVYGKKIRPESESANPND